MIHIPKTHKHDKHPVTDQALFQASLMDADCVQAIIFINSEREACDAISGVLLVFQRSRNNPIHLHGSEAMKQIDPFWPQVCVQGCSKVG